MCSHFLVEPVACTPASGWEKGQVENQVGLVRERFLTPRLRVRSYEELNAWLLDQCLAYAKAHRHPEFQGRTIWQVFEAERPSLVPHAGRFDGFHAVPASVSKTCLVRFDNNKYSVMASAVGRPVEIRAYADRIELRQDGRIVGQHRRSFGRGETVYDPWHYVRPRPQAWGSTQRRAVQGLDSAGRPGADPAQARQCRRRRPPDGRDPVRGPERRPAGGRGGLHGGAARRGPFRRRRLEHPGASSRARAATDDCHA
jgi:hypothetical protein